MKKLDAVSWLLIILFILTVVMVSIAANASEPLISIYDSPSDKTKSVVECSFENGRPDQRLVIKNSELESDKVIKWVDNVCLGRPK